VFIGTPSLFSQVKLDVKIAIRSSGLDEISDGTTGAKEIVGKDGITSELLPSNEPWPFAAILQPSDKDVKVEVIAKSATFRDPHPAEIIPSIRVIHFYDPIPKSTVGHPIGNISASESEGAKPIPLITGKPVCVCIDEFLLRHRNRYHLNCIYDGLQRAMILADLRKTLNRK
jgi:hypothetical protein